MIKQVKLLFFLLAVCFALPATAQVTTSALAGVVAEQSGETLIGATITATHTPSGTKYNAVTNIQGRFTIQGMRVGGPYTVTVSYVGYETTQYNDIYLELGNTYKLDVTMNTGAHELEGLVVTGQAQKQEAGASHNFSAAQINEAVTIDRNIYDVVQNMPLANRSKQGGISFAGTNNRYNSFQIDGTVSNDVFGLNSDGTNGSNASANPISMDAIQEIQVVVAPFDVRQSGFTGGGINAITKQGNNDFHATFYTYYNNQNFYGRYDASQDYIKSKLTKQHYFTIGGNLSGPIVKDKLFFFVNVESHSESYPASYYPGVSSNYLSVADAQKIADKYYQVTGTQEAFAQRNVDQRSFDLLARLDWNINSKHKLALRYQFLNAYDDKYSSSYTSYYFNNSSFRFTDKTHSIVAELNSNFSESFYNELRLSYTRVRDNREVPYQGPTFWIKNVGTEDGSRSNIYVDIGTEYSSGANRLDQDIYVLEDNLSWYKGDHTITFGTHNEFYHMDNLFIQTSNGEWVYNSLEDFFNDQPNQFVFKCSNPELTNGNLRWSPIIKAGQFGLYAQDKWEVNRNLQLTYGLRIDIPMTFNSPTANEKFNAYAEQKGWDVKVGEMPSAKVMFSPRVGFRWFTNDDHKTLIRGGIGLFTGRVPFVWLSNAYCNNGVEITGTTINNAADIPAITGNTQDLISALGKGIAPTPDIVTISKNFRYPQVLRANLAWEQRFWDDWKFTLEGLYSKTFYNAYFKNLALTQSGSVYAVEGVEASAAPFYSVDNSYYSIINMKNSNKGYSYNLAATLEKKFNFGLNFLVNYTYGRSRTINDCTNSVAYSNWKYQYAIDTNNPRLSYSVYDQPHRVLVSVGYTTPKYANGWLQTNIAVNYNGYTGQRYTLTMNESVDYNGDGSKGNSLLYLPTAAELQSMVFTDITAKDADGNTYVKTSAAEQKALFEEFLSTDRYAKKHRGEYAEAYGNLGHWENQIDLHFAQSIFYLKERGSKIQLTLDILNFANMLNKKWGASWGSTRNVTVLKVTGLARKSEGVYVPKFQWNDYTKPVRNNISSRWHAQIGVKVTF